MRNRFITFIAAMALSLTALGMNASIGIGANTQIISPSGGGGTGGDQCGVRRTTGNGGTKHFCKGESVDGAVITLNGGKTGYACHFRHAPRSGKVESGVIRYFPAEADTPLCKNTLMSPGPRKEAGKDGRKFQKGDHVLGFAIEINVDPRGRTYFDCAIVKAEADGFVFSGLVNPSRFEIRDMQRRCLKTQNWNPGFRVESGDGVTIHFYAGEPILGAYILYDGGTERFNCYDRVANTDGVLTSGVVNYWPSEATPPNAC